MCVSSVRDLELDLSALRERESVLLSPYDYVCLSPGTPEAGRRELQDLLLDERRQRREAEQQLAISSNTHNRTKRESVERARASARDTVLARARVLELSAMYALEGDEAGSRAVDVGEREDRGRRWHDAPHTAVRQKDRGKAVNEMLGSPGKSPMLRENILREIRLERRQARSRRAPR